MSFSKSQGAEGDALSPKPGLVQRAVGRGSLFRNALAGGVATGADFAVVSLLVEGLRAALPLATFVGCVAGGLINFGINRRWVFASELGYLRQGARYVVVSGGSALLNVAVVWILSALLTGPYGTIWVLGRTLVFVAYNYPLHRNYVFASTG